MKIEFSKEIKVGIIVTAALVCAIWGINYLKGRDLFSLTNTYYAVYPQVNGLYKSNLVKLNGYKIGQVTGITYLPDNSGRIKVKMEVSSKVFVSSDSKASIASADLLGTKEIQIQLGTSKTPANDGDSLTAIMELGLTETLGNQVGPVKEKFEKLMVSIDSLATNLNTVLGTKNKEHLTKSFSSLEVTMKNLESITVSLDKMMQSGGSANSALNNFSDISKTIKENNAQLDKIIDNAASISDSLNQANLKSTIENLNSAITELKETLSKINNGEGSLGKLVNDKQLYDNLAATSASLNSMLVDMQANPKRYVHFSVFGKKDKTQKTDTLKK